MPRMRILSTPRDYLAEGCDSVQQAINKLSKQADCMGWEGTRRDLDNVWLDMLRIQSAIVNSRGRPGVVTLASRVQAQEEA